MASAAIAAFALIPGKDPVTAIRLSPELRTAIDDWRRKQDDLPSRSEAIRRLVEQALGAEPDQGE